MTADEEILNLKKENERLKKLLNIQETANINPSIEELIDIEALKDIFERFSTLTGYTSGFVKQDTREVLISTGWTKICKSFHREAKSSVDICTQSNIELTRNLEETHQISMKECQHGMVDGATPIIIDGEHLADIFSGQVLFQKPDIEKFKLSASEFGYDIKSYIEALEDVKVTSKEKLHEVLEFLSAIAKIIAELGKDKKEYLKLNASLEKQIKKRTSEQNILLSLFDYSDTVLFKWNNDENWSVDYVSKSVDNLLNISKDKFENNHVVYSSLIHADDIEFVIKEVQTAIKEEKKFFSHKPYRVKTKNNSYKWILDNTVIIRDKNNNITHFLGYLNDITKLKEYQDKLKKLSVTDQLTKAYNRLYIDQLLEKQYYRFIRDHEECSIILIDIDYFKKINDTYGHTVGDQVLIEFTKLIQESIRDSDTLGRWGGEEFLIVSPHSNKESAFIIAEKIRQKISLFDFQTVGQITASFGVSEFTKDVNITSLFETVDLALYKSKENGRNKVSF